MVYEQGLKLPYKSLGNGASDLLFRGPALTYTLSAYSAAPAGEPSYGSFGDQTQSSLSFGSQSASSLPAVRSPQCVASIQHSDPPAIATNEHSSPSLPVAPATPSTADLALSFRALARLMQPRASGEPFLSKDEAKEVLKAPCLLRSNSDEGGLGIPMIYEQSRKHDGPACLENNDQ
jgi:hypothetical protein